MIIGDRLRLLREQQKLSQNEIERRTGLLRCYISRVENNHTTPSLETLEKMAGGLKIPLYQLFYEASGPAELPKPTLDTKAYARDGWGDTGKDARFLKKLRLYLSEITPRDRQILMAAASQLLKQKTRRNLKSG
jgi:transcriptional regulator with XRE-family HTH domain